MKNKVGSKLRGITTDAPAVNPETYWLEDIWSTIIPEQEDIMSMEKRAVVETTKEKTAHKKIEKKAGTVTGRTPSGKPNQANAPKGNKDG